MACLAGRQLLTETDALQLLGRRRAILGGFLAALDGLSPCFEPSGELFAVPECCLPYGQTCGTFSIYWIPV